MTDADKVAAVKKLRQAWIKQIGSLQKKAARASIGYASGVYEGKIKALESVIACLDAEAHMGECVPLAGPALGGGR